MIADFDPLDRRVGQALIRSLVGSYIGRSETTASYGVPATSTVQVPAFSQSAVSGCAGVEHGQADGAAEGPAVRRGADVADHLAVAEHQLGVVQHRVGVGEPDLDEPAVRDAGGLDAGDRVLADEARLVEVDGEAEPGLDHVVGVVDVVPEVAVALLHPAAGQRLEADGGSAPAACTASYTVSASAAAR